MATRIAMHRGAGQVIGVDLVPERLERARENGVEALDLREHDNLAERSRSSCHPEPGGGGLIRSVTPFAVTVTPSPSAAVTETGPGAITVVNRAGPSSRASTTGAGNASRTAGFAARAGDPPARS
jgi:threonine dehydrogenase-like Zn-dependent dehydrogenase